MIHDREYPVLSTHYQNIFFFQKREFWKRYINPFYLKNGWRFQKSTKKPSTAMNQQQACPLHCNYKLYFFFPRGLILGCVPARTNRYNESNSSRSFWVPSLFLALLSPSQRKGFSIYRWSLLVWKSWSAFRWATLTLRWIFFDSALWTYEHFMFCFLPCFRADYVEGHRYGDRGKHQSVPHSAQKQPTSLFGPCLCPFHNALKIAEHVGTVNWKSVSASYDPHFIISTLYISSNPNLT